MSDLLLDTNALIWTMIDARRLGRNARRQIVAAAKRDNIVVSAISYGELAMLIEKGRLRIPFAAAELRDRAIRLGYREAPLTGAAAIDAAGLASLSRDPADRYIAATARLLKATLVTSDSRMLEWQGDMARLDAQR